MAGCFDRVVQLLERGLSHLFDEALKGDGGGPTEKALSLARIAGQLTGFDFSDEAGVRSDVIFPREADAPEGNRQNILDRVKLPRCEDIVFRRFMLEAPPHGVHGIASMAPIALRGNVAQLEFTGEAEFDGCGGITDFARHEVVAATWRFVIIQDSIDRKYFESLPISSNHVRRECFRATIGSDRSDGRGLILW